MVTFSTVTEHTLLCLSHSIPHITVRAGLTALPGSKEQTLEKDNEENNIHIICASAGLCRVHFV